MSLNEKATGSPPSEWKRKSREGVVGCEGVSSESTPPFPCPPLHPEGRELKLWFDGELASADALQPPLTTHAMNYGSAVFCGLRSYATRHGAAVFRIPNHPRPTD